MLTNKAREVMQMIINPTDYIDEFPLTEQDWKQLQPHKRYDVIYHDDIECRLKPTQCTGWHIIYDVAFMHARVFIEGGFAIEFAITPLGSGQILRIYVDTMSARMRLSASNT